MYQITSICSDPVGLMDYGDDIFLESQYLASVEQHDFQA